jgi:hypothetical protein
MDTFDEIRRRRNQSDDPRAKQSAEEFAAAQRRAQEQSLARLEHEPERKRIAADYSKAKRTLSEIVYRLPHGTRLDDDEFEHVLRDVLRDLGGQKAKAETIVRSYLKDVTASIADGDKARPWALAEDAAERLVNSGWKQSRVPASDPTEGMTPAQLAEQIRRG